MRADGPSTGLNFVVGQQSRRLVPSIVASAGIQLAVVVIFLLLGRYVPPSKGTAFIPDMSNDSIVWLSQPGPGGGGGGGGNRSPEPPRVVETVGKEKISVPVEKPPALEVKTAPKPLPEPEKVQEVNIPAKELGASTELLPGAIDAPTAPVASASLGSGTGSGAGTGRGSGSGSGQGSGLGEGSGGGTGGGVYRPGNGVTDPRPIREVRPTYSSDAMRARIQGEVWVQCIVQLNGSCTDSRVVRSLGFGLDEEALKAASEWRFQPGTRLGQPVKVEIVIALSFSLR